MSSSSHPSSSTSTNIDSTFYSVCVSSRYTSLEDGKMIAVSGSYSRENEVRRLSKNVFSDKLGFVAYKLDVPMEPTNDHRTTADDFTGDVPKFFIEGNRILIGL
jgi:hypothetical protein